MIECKSCLYKSNHPLGILFNQNGVCTGCTVHLEKDLIDWRLRKESLLELVADYRNQSSYDCIVPVTGGQDSYFIVHYIVNELKLRPLLVNFNRIMNTREGIENLQRLRTIFGLDLQQSTINPLVARRVIQCTLANLGTLNWFWIAGQSSLPVRLARDLNIPLIIWGAHQGVEQVGMYSHFDNAEMTKRYRKEHDLLGIDENDIFNFDCGFDESDIYQLKYPNDRELLHANVRGIYLSNYVRWDPYAQHELMVKTYNYQGRKTIRTYYNYDNPDCVAYMSLQDKLKSIKFGYGKVTDQLCREIRHKRIRKQDAEAINRSYLSREDKKSIVKFLNWLGSNNKSYDLLKLNTAENFLKAIMEFLDHKNTLSAESKELTDNDFDLFGKGIFTD